MFYNSSYVFDCVITSPVLIKMKGIWTEVTGSVNARATQIEFLVNLRLPSPNAAHVNFLSDYTAADYSYF